MATLDKIVKVTQAQYDTLAAGGTVGDYTGLNSDYIYLIQSPQKYVHNIYLSANSVSTSYQFTCSLQLITESSTQITSVAALNTALTNAGFTYSNTRKCPASGFYAQSNSGYWSITGVWPADTSGTGIYFAGWKIANYSSGVLTFNAYASSNSTSTIPVTATYTSVSDYVQAL